MRSILGMYPLGSCTMKYNPRVNEFVSRVEGLANGHPYQPAKISQGAMRIMKTLSDWSDRDHGHGRDHAAAGGGRAWRIHRTVKWVRAYHESEGECAQEDTDSRFRAWDESRDGSHGWYAVENLKSNDRGMVDVAALAAQMNEDVAGASWSPTAPTTLGVFEQGDPQNRENLMQRQGRPLLYHDRRQT